MFENLKEKREKERQNRLIKMAEENGISDKQYYDTYAKGIYELYNSFRLAGFEHDDAFELTKICIINQCVNPYAALDKQRGCINGILSFEYGKEEQI